MVKQMRRAMAETTGGSTTHSQSLQLRATVQIRSPMMFDMVTRNMGRFGGWDSVGQWMEHLWCMYTDRNNMDCESHMGNGRCATQTHRVCKTFPVENIQTDVEYVDDVKIEGRFLSVVHHPDSPDERCVFPDKCVVEYSKVFCTKDWSFRIKKSWSSQTIKKALACMDTQSPSMCIQVDLLRLHAYFDKHSDAYIATSMLMKVACIFGERCRMF